MPATRYPDLDEIKRMPAEKRAELRWMLANCFPYFIEYTFWHRYRVPYIWTRLHRIICHTLGMVDAGKWIRVIVNAMPRSGKTELVSQIWPAWHYLRWAGCGFMLVGAGDDLAADNSSSIKEILKLPEIVYLFKGSLRFRRDIDNKHLWRTDAGGWLRAASSGGQLTGFGFGRLGATSFSGACIVDDPNKPDDWNSAKITERFNRRYMSTIARRGNGPRVPIIVNQQRTGDGDLSAFLLGGGSGERWIHVRIPAKVEPGDMARAAERYQSGGDWDHGIPIDLDLPDGFVWPEKYGEREDNQLLAASLVRSAQFYQNTEMRGGAVFRISWFKRYETANLHEGLQCWVVFDGKRIVIKEIHVYADTAQKMKEQNDFSVFQLWGVGVDGNLYLLDQLRGKWESPELKTESEVWLRKYADARPRRFGWRDIRIEDKASGTGLIQQLNRIWGTRVQGIPRAIDKVSRAMSAALPLSEGRVYIPQSAPWVADYLAEFQSFSKDDSHAHDDQVDPTMDAIEDLLSKGASIYDCL